MSGENTIRAQAKSARVQGKKINKDEAPAPVDGRERMDKEVVKAVLASPLITPWPNLPMHLQKSVMAALPKLVPKEIAEYHISRARCHQKEKKHRKQALKPKQGEEKTDAEARVKVKDGEQAADQAKDVEIALPDRPTPPAILQHLVLGINETIKTLERNIDDLKFRLMLMADAINATDTALPLSKNGLLPTAPRTPSPSPGPAEAAPLGWVVVPVLSVSPQSLVSPIPQYCATYNSLVYQWTQLQKTIKSRLKEDRWGEVLGDERSEIQVVPLGKVEAEMAVMVGLRRLACLGVRKSHPDIHLLEALLPKSVLHPPRHHITLPFPSSTLRVHTSAKRKDPPAITDEVMVSDKPTKKAKTATSLLPVPNVHYAPLVVKGIITTTPKDGNAKKQKRLEEVRQKRIEVKERKKVERKEAFKKGLKGEEPKVPRHGAKKTTKSSKKNVKGRAE